MKVVKINRRIDELQKQEFEYSVYHFMKYISINLPLFLFTPGQFILCATFEYKLYIEHINVDRKAENKQNTLTIVVPLRTVVLHLLYLATKSSTSWKKS